MLHGVKTMSRASTKFLKFARKSAEASSATSTVSETMPMTKTARVQRRIVALLPNEVRIVSVHMNAP